MSAHSLKLAPLGGHIRTPRPPRWGVHPFLNTSMRTLDTVEDYITELYEGSNIGYVRANRDNIGYRLASYDIRIVQSIYNQVTFQNLALTDKQAELCVKLVEKYTRQFRRAGIDNFAMLDSRTRKFKFTIRKVDREFKLYIENDFICAKFPYDIKIIQAIRKTKEKIAGTAEWNRDNKIWQFLLTEPYVKFTVEFGKEYDFDIDQQLLKLYDKITADYDKDRIRLVADQQGKYQMLNAPASLSGYLEKHAGSELLKLVDYSGICAYEVDNNIAVQIKQAYSDGVSKCLMNRHIYLDPAQYTFWEIFDYAELVDRFPVTVYDTLGHWSAETNFSHTRDRYLKLYEKYGPIYHHDIVLPKDWPYKNADPDTAKVKIYHTATKEMFEDDRIPLMISCQNFNFGSLRMQLLAKADKIVYHCTKL